MLPLLITSIAFGTLPIIYKGLLLKGINNITILITTKILIALLCIIFLLIGSDSNTIYKDIKYIFNKNTYISVILLTLFGAIVGVTGQYYYIKSVELYKTNVSTIIIASYPVLTLVLAYLYFSETITYLQTIGSLLIFAGIIMIGY